MYFFLLTSKTLEMQYFVCYLKQITQEDKYSKIFFEKVLWLHDLPVCKR